MRTPARPALAVLCAIVTAGCSPGVAASPTRPDFTVSVSANGDRITASGRGDLRLTDDGLDIASLGPDGELTITRGTWLRRVFLGGERTVILRTAAGGTLRREFLISGAAAPYEPDGAAWMADALSRLLAGGFLARERVDALLRTSGVDGVARAIPALATDHLQARYLRYAFERHDGVPSLAPLLAVAAREIASDLEMSRLLQQAAGLVLQDPQARAAFFAAAATITSDDEHAQVLSTVLAAGPPNLAASPPDDDTLSALLYSAAGIESDRELAQLLVRVAALGPLSPALQERYLTVAASLSSEHERARALAALVQRPAGAPQSAGR